MYPPAQAQPHAAGLWCAVVRDRPADA